MKIKLPYILIFLIATALITSCKKDNYAPPSSLLSGRVVYKGDAIGVEYNQVPFQIYQFGLGKVGAINGSFAPDGTYSVLLFDGDYKFIIPNGKGPFLWKKTAAGNPDSLTISMRGSQTLDIEVLPYYMIRNAQFNASGGKITGTFKAEKVITDALARDIESVNMYINKTQFVSGADNISSANLAGSAIADPNNVSLSVTIPGIVPTQNYVFATISIKIRGVENRIFSPVQKISF